MVDIKIIQVSEVEKYLKFAELKREFLVRLTIFKEGQELQLKRTEIIRSLADRITALKQVLNIKLDADIAKEIRKYKK